MMDEDEVIDRQLYDGDPSDFPEETRASKPFPHSLPPTDDKEYWGNAESHQVTRLDLEKRKLELYAITRNHTIKQIGQEFICNSCPYEHSIPLDPNHYTLDTNGTIIPKNL